MPDLKEITNTPLKMYWEEDNHQYNLKHALGLRLTQYAYGKQFDYSTKLLPSDDELRTKIIKSYRGTTKKKSSRQRQFSRLLLGYYGIHVNLTPKRCDLSSKEANKIRRTSSTTNDHIIGMTDTAIYIKNEFIKDVKIEDWLNLGWIEGKIEYMCNDWLPDHLWLWAQCRLTRDEHRSGNLPRATGYEVGEKRMLKHYEDAGIEVEKYL